MNPDVFFLETTSRVTSCSKIGTDIQYLTFHIKGCGCDDDWTDSNTFSYIADVKRIGIRVTGILRHLAGQRSGEDDGEWKDRETSRQYRKRHQLELFCRQADIPLQETGDYWAHGFQGATLKHWEVFSFDLIIANCDLYFGHPALALVAFTPVAEIEITRKDGAFKTDMAIIAGAPTICRVGEESGDGWDDSASARQRTCDFLRQGKLIHVENTDKDYPNWVWDAAKND